MPPVAMALKIPWMPEGAKPWEWKLPPWNAVNRNATTTRLMMASFQATSTLLSRANQRIPK